MNRAWLAAVLTFAVSGAAFAAAPSHASADAFDALFAELDALPLLLSDSAPERQADYARLQALLPPGDAVRELRYRALSCGPGDHDDDARIAAEAEAQLEQARRLGDAESQVRLLYCRSAASGFRRGERAALAYLDQGIALARTAGLAKLLGEGLSLRAGVLSVLGEQAHALIALMEAQQVFEKAELESLADANLLGLGVAYRRMGEFELALDHLRRGERSARERGDWGAAFTSLLQQGYLHQDRGDGTASLAPLQQALALAERNGLRRDAAAARIALASSRILLGEHVQALGLLDQAGRVVGGDYDQLSMLLHLRRGEAFAGLGRHREALEQFHHVAAALVGSDNLRYQALLYRARAGSLEALGRMPEALAEYRRLLEARTELDRIAHGQVETLMHHQFDMGRRDAEHRRLAAEKAVHDAQLEAGLRARHWRQTALASGAVLLVLLAGLGLRQRRRGRRLHALAMTDPLTGAANRRSLERFAAAAIDAARPPARPVAVIALDVDHFKHINDRHGHAVGDDVLRRVTAVCQRELRQCDLLGRTGGEEFVAVLPGTSLDAAQRVAQRLLAGIRALELDGIADGLKVTASLGVAEYLSADGDLARLLQRADAALYRAKRSGRDRVECDDGTQPVDGAGGPPATVRMGGSSAASAPAGA